MPGIYSSGFKRQTVTTLSGSGNYNTPVGCSLIKIYMYGPGGGGAGGGTTAAAGSNGTSATSFGTNLLSCDFGRGGTDYNSAGAGGQSTTINSPAIKIRAVNGGNGSGASGLATAGGNGFSIAGGSGGCNPMGGMGGNLNDPAANCGAGGEGGQCVNQNNTTAHAGSAGGAGSYLEALIENPFSINGGVFPYVIGSGGTGGVGTLSTAANGSNGSIIVEEFY